MSIIEQIKNGAKFVVILLLITSCNPEPEGGSQETPNGDYTIKVIDSCEYIEYDYGIFDQRVYSITHKGNCKYCTERSKKSNVVIIGETTQSIQ